MILESTQLLSNAYYDGKDKPQNSIYVSVGRGFLISTRYPILDERGLPKFYKPTHWNNPCTIWTRKYQENWDWLWALAYYLCSEYQKDTGRVHSCFEIVLWMMGNKPNLPKNGKISRRPQVMPEDLRVFKKPIRAYRKYYATHKIRIAKWNKNRVRPTWLDKYITV